MERLVGGWVGVCWGGGCDHPNQNPINPIPTYLGIRPPQVPQRAQPAQRPQQASPATADNADVVAPAVVRRHRGGGREVRGVLVVVQGVVVRGGERGGRGGGGSAGPEPVLLLRMVVLFVCGCYVFYG